MLDRSPINVAVGRLIKTWRVNSGHDTQALVQAFGVSAPYIRAIEAGSRALPAYSVVGLVEQFKLKWSAAMTVVAIASFMDLARTDDKYDPDKLRRLASRLRLMLSNSQDLFDQLEALIDLDQAEWADRIPHLAAAIEYAAKHSDHKQFRGVMGPMSLNPVFEDLSELIMDQLALFPPHVNATAIQRWEGKNNHRILSLRGYVTDGAGLTESVEHFDWKSFRTNKALTIHVLVDAPTDQAKQIEVAFRQALAKTLRTGGTARLATRVHVRSALPHKAECKRALRFDFATRARAAEGTPPSDAQRDFPNAWIYELAPESASGDRRCIGFLMDTDPAKGYAVAMNREHVTEWVMLFRRFWAGEPSRASGRRTNRIK